MNIKGPFGLFALKDEPIDIVFAATGAGIAPFRSQILDMIDKKSTREIHLFFGARTPKDFFWTEELRTLERKHPNIHVHLCLSRDDPSWTGHRGRVQQFIPAVIKDPLTTQIYICGAPEMVGDIKKVAIETWGMPKANVHAEGYI